MMRRWLGMMAVFLIATSPVQGQVYQWVDENGVKHYSNTPPPDGVTGLRTYEEVQSEPDADPGDERQTQSIPEAGEETAVETPEQPIEENPPEVEESEAGEVSESEEAEDAGGLEEGVELEESGDLENADAADTEDDPDIETDSEEEGPEGPTSGQPEVDELIAQERDRLEVRMVQLNRQLVDAQTARDRGSDSDVKRWTRRIEQLRAQIEKERNRSEARIEEIRNNNDVRQ